MRNNHILGIFIAILLASVTWILYAQTKSITFDEVVWQATDPSQSNLRYKMSADLIRLAKVERWNREKIVKKLGRPDMSDIEILEGKSVQNMSITYQLGKRSLGPFNLNSFYLHVRFNMDSSLLSISVHPE